MLYLIFNELKNIIHLSNKIISKLDLEEER